MADREHYADLLRLAYLVLDDGDAPLMRARRAAAGAARGRPGGYPAMRARLVGILLTGPPPAGHRPHRLFVEPARIPPGPVRAALQELAPYERLAYLLRLDGLTAPEVAAELRVHTHADFESVDRATAAVDGRTRLDEAAQRAEIEAFDPGLVRLRPPRTVSRAAVAAVLAAVLLAVAAVVLTRPDERPGAPAEVDPRAWQATGTPTIHEWRPRARCGTTPRCCAGPPARGAPTAATRRTAASSSCTRGPWTAPPSSSCAIPPAWGTRPASRSTSSGACRAAWSRSAGSGRARGSSSCWA
ncbi:hypothetical protein LUX57_38120 [Actinomadura madurae]|uniref:hypothetical protein n=1 Tax=Actinomadura madurae TaxID=1993 RepID=UPI0020D20C60|nr:hypothetical protein [Actinomadura madurae]MCP9970285.1 hypothetical protein [Actinomadura madurae]